MQTAAHHGPTALVGSSLHQQDVTTTTPQEAPMARITTADRLTHYHPSFVPPLYVEGYEPCHDVLGLDLFCECATCEAHEARSPRLATPAQPSPWYRHHPMTREAALAMAASNGSDDTVEQLGSHMRALAPMLDLAEELEREAELDAGFGYTPEPDEAMLRAYDVMGAFDCLAELRSHAQAQVADRIAQQMADAQEYAQRLEAERRSEREQLDEWRARGDMLAEVQDQMQHLLRQARQLVRDTPEERRAELYWLAHIEAALGSSCPTTTAPTMQDAIDALLEE